MYTSEWPACRWDPKPQNWISYLGEKEQSQELSSETHTCLEVRKQEEVLEKELEMEQPKVRKSQKECGVPKTNRRKWSRKDKGPIV